MHARVASVAATHGDTVLVQAGQLLKLDSGDPSLLLADYRDEY